MNSRIIDIKGTALRLLFFILSFSLLNSLKAQKFQPGATAGLNTTIFHKGESVYDSRLFHTIPIPGIALSLPVYIKLGNSWSLKTGLGYQMKHYRIIQSDFDAPDLVGYMYFSEGFAAGELPLVLSFKSSGYKKTKIEYSAGCILTMNVPMGSSMGSSISGSGSSPDNPNSLLISSSTIEGKNTFSPDLYFGISLVNFKDKMRRHQFTVSYQYGLIPTSPFAFMTVVESNSSIKVQNVILKPTLSCFAITYTFFPVLSRSSQ